MSIIITEVDEFCGIFADFMYFEFSYNITFGAEEKSGQSSILEFRGTGMWR